MCRATLPALTYQLWLVLLAASSLDSHFYQVKYCAQGDDSTNRFLRIMINLAVSHSLKHEAASQQPTQLSYLALDGFVRLIVLLVNGQHLLTMSWTVLPSAVCNVRILSAYKLCPGPALFEEKGGIKDCSMLDVTSATWNTLNTFVISICPFSSVLLDAEGDTWKAIAVSLTAIAGVHHPGRVSYCTMILNPLNTNHSHHSAMFALCSAQRRCTPAGAGDGQSDALPPEGC